MNSKKGQTTMIVAIFVIILFMVMGVFFVTSFIRPESDEYQNLYVHNLLLSVLRSSTGYQQPCETVASTLSCSYLTPYRSCGGEMCSNVSDTIIPETIEKTIKPGFDYYFIVQPENWKLVGGRRIVYGNPSVEKKKPRWTANEKVLQYGANLHIQMIIARR